LRQVQGDLFRSYFRLLLSDRLARPEGELGAENTLEITGDHGQSARLLVQADTGCPSA